METGSQASWTIKAKSYLIEKPNRGGNVLRDKQRSHITREPT